MFTQTMRSKAVDLTTLLSICSPVYQANFAFACRILQRDPHLYTHILMDNPENIAVLNHFVYQAQESIKLLQNKDEKAFMKQFLENREFLGDHGKDFSNQSDYLVEKMKQYGV
jgi:prephenate dehydrogenase